MRRLGLAVALFGGVSIAFTPAVALAQSAQNPDTGYRFANSSPVFKSGSGPSIGFSAHNSKYVQNGLHGALAKLAAEDGFQAADVQGATPGRQAIFVLINNYLPSFGDHSPMEPPSAFSPAEIEAIRVWVEAGGSLLILADHAPLGGGASALAAAFGFTILNGWAADERAAQAGIDETEIEFAPGAGLATDHAVTNGNTGRKPIQRFHAFGGQAFIPPPQAATLLRIPQGWSAIFSFGLEPAALKSAPRIDASGMAQGAVLEYGKGRIAVFAEAGGFSAQFGRGGRRHGFNTPEGADNPEFVLAVLRWLARYEPKGK